jgi:hypothetical protein
MLHLQNKGTGMEYVNFWINKYGTYIIHTVSIKNAFPYSGLNFFVAEKNAEGSFFVHETDFPSQQTNCENQVHNVQTFTYVRDRSVKLWTISLFSSIPNTKRKKSIKPTS